MNVTQGILILYATPATILMSANIFCQMNEQYKQKGKNQLTLLAVGSDSLPECRR
jgi:hypothetical protein